MFAGTEAVRVQVPPVRKVAFEPETEHTDGVVEPNVIVPFEDELALRVAVVPADCAPRAVNVMVCDAKVTVVDCITCGAAV